jgi:hypothetical protein
MAGDWIKIEHVTPDKPEIHQIAEELGIDSDAVVGKLMRFWIWADQQAINGNAIPVTKTLIDRITYAPGFADALLKVDWLQARSGSFAIPHFDRHNGQTAKKRAETNRRVAEHRKRNADSVTNVTQTPLQKALPEKRRDENIVSITQNGRAHEIPSVDQVKAYAASAPVPITEACAVAFHDTQQAAGWITKHGHSIADWQAALRRYASLWNENEKSRTNGHKADHRQTKSATEYPEPKPKLPRL